MSIPFGFSLEGGSDGDGKNELANLFERLSQFMQSGNDQNGPVNWRAVEQTSSEILRKAGDPRIDADFPAQLDSAVNLADLWLTEVTAFPSSGDKPIVLTRAGWIAQTMQAWQALVDPVAHGLSEAMETIIPKDIADGPMAVPQEILDQLPPEFAEQFEQMLNSGQLGDLLGQVMDLTKSMGATLFGTQFGQGLGEMSTKVLTATDVGIPLTKSRNPGFIASNIQEFSSGLNVPLSDALLYLALRELAHQRLFTAAPWLESHIQSAMANYARAVRIDTSAIEQALAEIDPTDMEAVTSALSGDLFIHSQTPEQKSALERLELLIALVESWVVTVVGDAVGNRLPTSNALAETLRRRRAAGGPAEKFFEGIIGLEIRPRKIREAELIWRTLTEKVGITARDNIWTHPDLLPTSTDLEDIDFYLANQSHDLMTDLQRLLDEPESSTE